MPGLGLRVWQRDSGGCRALAMRVPGLWGWGFWRRGRCRRRLGRAACGPRADAPIKDRQGRLHTFSQAAPGRWHVMGVTNGAGLSFRYFRDTFAPGSSYEELTAKAAEAPAGSEGTDVGSLSVWRADPAS